MAMQIRVIPCGFLKVRAVEMIRPWSIEKIRQKYPVDDEGYMKLSMNALLVNEGKRMVLMDPGTADFLPASLKQEYGFDMQVPLEEVLEEAGVSTKEITDVVFTHLHFDHGSGAFKRIPGNIVKRFPQARYHVLKKHYEYALNPDRVEANSFSTVFFRRLDEISWLEDWNCDWMKFMVLNGHTLGMAVPVIQWETETIYFVSDLFPLEVFLEPEVYCGYDLDPELQIREKKDFLDQLDSGSHLFLYHDTLKDSIIYS